MTLAAGVRFLRIFLSTILCVLLIFVAAYLQDPATESDTVFTAIGNALFVLLVLGPISLPWLLVLTGILAVMDARGLGRLWHHVLLWCGNGLLIRLAPGVAAATGLPVLLLQSALAGALYWALAGRLAGMPETALRDIAWRPPMQQGMILAGVVLAALGVAWVVRESIRAFGPM